MQIKLKRWREVAVLWMVLTRSERTKSSVDSFSPTIDHTHERSWETAKEAGTYGIYEGGRGSKTRQESNYTKVYFFPFFLET